MKQATEKTEERKGTGFRQAFAIVERNGKSHWLRIGTAFKNRDGSETVYLDALPVNGRIQIREAEARNGASAEPRDATA